MDVEGLWFPAADFFLDVEGLWFLAVDFFVDVEGLWFPGTDFFVDVDGLGSCCWGFCREETGFSGQLEPVSV